METTTSETKGSIPTLLKPDPPVRILVQTLTHLVPGNGGIEKRTLMLNRIFQHLWNCDFNAQEYRWNSYNDAFAFNNRRCLFLVDYGQSPCDDNVPILSYEWTGESL